MRKILTAVAISAAIIAPQAQASDRQIIGAVLGAWIGYELTKPQQPEQVVVYQPQRSHGHGHRHQPSPVVYMPVQTHQHSGGWISDPCPGYGTHITVNGRQQRACSR